MAGLGHDTFAALAAMYRRLGRWPTVQEYAQHMGVEPTNELADALLNMRRTADELIAAIERRRT